MAIDSAAQRLAAVYAQQQHNAFPALDQEIVSQEFCIAIATDLAEWSRNRKPGENIDCTPFRALRRELMLLPRAAEALLWEAILLNLEKNHSTLYHQVHKGEPFYWMAIAAYESRDFERVLYYMDCALAEDLEEFKDPPSEWHKWPAYLFVTFEHTNRNQAGLQFVQQMRESFEVICSSISNICRFDIQDYVGGLVWHALKSTTKPALRSAVTSFTTFVLEHEDRKRHLQLAPRVRTSRFTCEMFTLHLFKGCVLLETLIRSSNTGLGLQFIDKDRNPRKGMLVDFFQSEDILRKIAVPPHPKQLKGLQNLPQDATFADIENAAMAGHDTDTAIRTRERITSHFSGG